MPVCMILYIYIYIYIYLYAFAWCSCAHDFMTSPNAWCNDIFTCLYAWFYIYIYIYIPVCIRMMFLYAWFHDITKCMIQSCTCMHIVCPCGYVCIIYIYTCLCVFSSIQRPRNGRNCITVHIEKSSKTTYKEISKQGK